jgi:NADP-dependent 3-hydroxy acid dehydrogenase YdfG
MRSAVWITGAGSGIGKSLALEFAENDIPVILSGRNEENLINVKNEILKNGSLCEIQFADVSSSESVFRACNNFNSKFNIDCLINNAGVTRFKSVSDHSIEEIDSIISTNLSGSIYTIKAVLPKMLEKNSGTIINILSVAVNTVFENSSVYSASKAGMSAFARVLREELRQTDIRVINIYPGAINTPIWPKEKIEKDGEKMMKPEDIAKHICRLYLLKDSVTTEEITFRPIQGDL